MKRVVYSCDWCEVDSSFPNSVGEDWCKEGEMWLCADCAFARNEAVARAKNERKAARGEVPQ